MDNNYIEILLGNVRVSAIQEAANVTPRAIRRWAKNGKMPRTEYTGETQYTEAILKIPNCGVTFDQLMPLPENLAHRWQIKRSRKPKTQPVRQP